MIKILVILCVVGHLKADSDDKKWVWGDGSRSAKGSHTTAIASDGKNARYEVFEDEEIPYRPQNPIGFNRPHENRPFINNRPQFIPNERPGGIYGGVAEPTGNYGLGGGNNYNPEQGILTGPVPSWVKEGPYKEFDRCKCTEKFNCNSPGISYGHCDVGKQYCCYSTKKGAELGGPPPSKPVHSIENGILVGPGGPTGLVNGPVLSNKYPRPGNGGYFRPNYANSGTRPYKQGGNIYSAENGILVGPGGPFDYPANRGSSSNTGYGTYGAYSSRFNIKKE